MKVMKYKSRDIVFNFDQTKIKILNQGEHILL